MKSELRELQKEQVDSEITSLRNHIRNSRAKLRTFLEWQLSYAELPQDEVERLSQEVDALGKNSHAHN